VTSTIAQHKSEMRCAMRVVRKGIAEPDRAAFHQQIAEALLQVAISRSASYVGIYSAQDSEADPGLFVEAWRERGGRFAWPRVAGDELHFHLSEGVDLLSPGFRGIQEPMADTPASAIDTLDLLVVPGLAFDRSGGRLGQGGGHYDRALQGLARPFTVGIAYASQLVDTVPMGDGDLRVDCVITENGIETP
jgi:5-formyltetrahydrofolate cyclo-ligase